MVAGIIGVILIYFIISIIRQQRRNQRLNQAKVLAEITTLESERKRIASDLHDEIGPLLSAVKLQINHLEPANEMDAELVEKSSKHIDSIIHRMREISNDLLPNVLVRKGLAPAIQDFIGKLQPATPTRIDFAAGETSRLKQSIEINVYRIVQEIVHNGVKHAQAKDLHIRLQHLPGMLKLVTEDNGIGYSYDETMQRKNGGHGLLNLKNRTEVMGGTFSFISEKGRGTKYLFEIPLHQDDYNR